MQDKGRENNMMKLNTTATNILNNNRRSDTIGSGITYQDSSVINNKLEGAHAQRRTTDAKDLKDAAEAEAAQARDGNKIAMWLPSFQEQQTSKDPGQKQGALPDKRVL